MNQFLFFVRFCFVFLGLFLILSGLLWCSFPYFNKFLVYESSVVSNQVDAIVVLGGGRGGRVKEAVDLLDQYHSRYLIMSGGHYYHTTTSRLMADYAKQLNVDLPSVLYEDNSYSTYDHVVNLLPMFRQYDIQSVLIVTSSFHTARSYAVFSSYLKQKGVAMDVFIHAAPDGIDYSRWWMEHEMLQIVAIESLKRVYYALFVT